GRVKLFGFATGPPTSGRGRVKLFGFVAGPPTSGRGRVRVDGFDTVAPTFGRTVVAGAVGRKVGRSLSDSRGDALAVAPTRSSRCRCSVTSLKRCTAVRCVAIWLALVAVSLMWSSRKWLSDCTSVLLLTTVVLLLPKLFTMVLFTTFTLLMIRGGIGSVPLTRPLTVFRTPPCQLAKSARWCQR